MLLKQIKLLVDRQAQLRKLLTDALIAMILGFWRGFRSWDDYDVVVANAARTATAVELANTRMRTQTRSYLTNYFKVIGDEESASAPLPDLGEEYPRDEVSALEVYMRPYKEYHYNKAKLERERAKNDERIAKIRADIAKGTKSKAEVEKEINDLRKEIETPEQRKARRAAEIDAATNKAVADFEAKNQTEDDKDWTDEDITDLEEELDRIFSGRRSDESLRQEAERLMEERLKKSADTDIQMARRNEALAFLNDNAKVIAFRRVIHPELSETGVCGVCVVAASRFYGKSDLEPIHIYCKCEVLPMTKDFDPGLILNTEQLNQYYREAGGNDIDKLSNTRYQEDEHGELGLVLNERSKKIVDRQKRKGFQGASATPSERRKFNRNDPHFHIRRDVDELFVLYKSYDRLKRRVLNGEQRLTATLQWEETRIQFLESRMSTIHIRQARQPKMLKRVRAKGSEGRTRGTTTEEFTFAKKNIQSEIDSLERTLPVLIELTANGTDRSQAVAWQKNRLKLLREMLLAEQNQ